MGFLPLFLRMDGRRCLVIGGGEVAARKAASLIEAGACVTVVSPTLVPSLEQAVQSGQAVHIGRPYREGDMEGYALVYAATDTPELASRLFTEAARLNIPINVADQPDFCSFIVPAVASRGRLQVAISTGGASPALSSRMRARAESVFGPHLAAMTEILAATREWLKVHEPELNERGRKLRNLTNGDLERALIEGDRAAVEQALAEGLEEPVALAELGIEARTILSRAGKAETP